MRIAYQGAPGAFGHEAALRFAPEHEPLACPTFAAVVEAVETGDTELGILPVENSRAGPVEEALAALKASRVRKLSEHAFPVRLHLLALPGARLEDVTIAVSHPMALKQCAASLARLGLATEEAPNTAIAARDLVTPHKAALASAAAAEAYDLETLLTDLQDDPDNATRFVIVSR